MAKARALISFAVTAKLIWAFVFAFADCWFFHAAAQMIKEHENLKYLNNTCIRMVRIKGSCMVNSRLIIDILLFMQDKIQAQLI